MSFGISAATAAVVGGGLAAAGSIGSALIGSKAAKNAANAQQDAASQQLALQREQFDLARQDQAPYRQIGTNALNELALRLGIGGYGGAIGGSGGAGSNPASQALTTGNLVQIGANGAPTYNPDLYSSNTAYRNAWDQYLQEHVNRFGGGYRFDSNADVIDQEIRNRLQGQADQEAKANPVEQNPLYGSLLKSFSQEDFQTDPGYEFRLGEGQKALESSAAARGGLLSGAAAKALTKYNQNFASNEYGNVFNRYQTEQGNVFNRLASLAGVGQTATNATQQAGQNFVSGAGNALQYGGSARASGYANQANALSGGLGALTGAGVNLFSNYGSSYSNPYGNYSATTAPVNDYYAGVSGSPLA